MLSKQKETVGRIGMANSYFQFKQFRIEQGQCAMKVSTDALVLGACVVPSFKVGTVLDIGTGTGVLALMMAQKFPFAQIEAVEVDKLAADQALRNFKNSPWPDRIQLLEGDFNRYKETASRHFDLIVCNPPYYPNHLHSPDQRKNLAHHQASLALHQLLHGVLALLEQEGQFWIILPPGIMDAFQLLAMDLGLYSCFHMELFDHPGSKELRRVMAFGRKKIEQALGTGKKMYLKDVERNFTPAYQSLLKDFMLYF
jgi:tRNA1Val (adenine37-N6)-methyltransferase